MASNFYATMAQVLPLLLLALIWDSEYLTRLRQQGRPRRRDDPAGVLFWTKPRVRAYILAVTAVVICSTALTILVLSGLISDSHALRIILVTGLLLVLATLMTRISIDVIQATASTGRHPARDQETADATGSTAAPSTDPAIGRQGQSLVAPDIAAQPPASSSSADQAS